MPSYQNNVIYMKLITSKFRAINIQVRLEQRGRRDAHVSYLTNVPLPFPDFGMCESLIFLSWMFLWIHLRHVFEDFTCIRILMFVCFSFVGGSAGKLFIHPLYWQTPARRFAQTPALRSAAIGHLRQPLTVTRIRESLDNDIEKKKYRRE